MKSAANPFATRFTQPGRLPFFFNDDASANLDALVEKLRASCYWGEIVGPHGTGKTTLLTQLLEAIATGQNSRHTPCAVTARGEDSPPKVPPRVARFTLRDGQRRLPGDWRATIDGAAVVAVDGYEQLGWWARRRLKSACRRGGAGLIVTAHAPTGLPTLYRTRPSLSAARHVIAQLLPPGEAPPGDDELTHLFDIFHGNMREMLFALYDRHEAGRSS